MITLKPQGSKIIVNPIETENFKTDSGLEIIQLELQEGVIMEVSPELEEIYNVGDTILFPKDAGITIMYSKKSCLFLDGRGAPLGDVWALVK